jgi:hypothetical protein
VLAQHLLDAVLVRHQLQALELGGVFHAGHVGVGHVILERGHAPRRHGLLVLHHAAQLGAQQLDVEGLRGGPELLVADLADGGGLGLDRVLVLAQQLDRVLHPSAQVDGARARRPTGELRELQPGSQQVEAIGRGVAVDVAAVLERRDDRAQLGLGGDAEGGEAVVVAQ